MLTLNGQFNINPSVVRGDKSISHRALILASIANGKSVIKNLPYSRDVMATVDCLRTLGAKIVLDDNTATVEPIKGVKNNVTLNCQNSGTTARLLAGLVAGLGVRAKFIGDGSLMKRPMDRVLKPLTQLGANFCKDENCLFESLGGKLNGKVIYSEVDSAQVKSAVLIAGLFADGQTTYVEQTHTRNHTELMMDVMGADISVNGLSVTVGKSTLNCLNTDIPCDLSSTAFLACAALICHKPTVFKNVLLNDRRTGFLKILKASGANIRCDCVRVCNGEKVGDILVETSNLTPLFASYADVCDSIDELPVLAAVALTVKGKHVFENVCELKYKESNRIQAIIDTAKACNQQAVFDGTNLTLTSDGILPKYPRFTSYNDHRMAMAQTVLCLACGGGSIDETPFDVSCAEFCQALGLNEYNLGLIGCDVKNSRSPLLMEHLANCANITCRYDLIQLNCDVTDDDILKVIHSHDGLNITMPFKARAASLLNADDISVNTVGKSIRPQSTDGYGIVKALTSSNIDFANKPLWIVGAGGASVACIETLLKYGCKMQVINRTQSHADMLTQKYGLSTNITEPYGILSFVPECQFEQNIKLPDSCKFVLVSAYKGQSRLKEQALRRGLMYIDGLKMLYHQGAKSFALWTGTDIQDDYEHFERFVKSCNIG